MGTYFNDSELPALVSLVTKLKPANYTYQQKIAILQILDLIIYSDDEADYKELKFLEVIIQNLELEVEILEIAINSDIHNSLNQLKLMTPLQKEIFKQLLLKMVLIDGVVATQESLILSKVFESLGIKL